MWPFSGNLKFKNIWISGGQSVSTLGHFVILKYIIQLHYTLCFNCALSQLDSDVLYYISLSALWHISDLVFSYVLLHTAEIICVDIMYFYGFPILNDPILFSGSSRECEVGLKPPVLSNPPGCKQQDIRNCSITKTPFTYGQNLMTCWTVEPLCSYCNNTVDYKWSFVAYSFPLPLLYVPCGECGITGLSHRGQQHFWETAAGQKFTM